MKIELACHICGSTFEREAREHKRSLKLGRNSYCSRTCQGKDHINNIPDYKRHSIDIKYAINRRDEYTGLREFIRRAKNRKQHEVNIDVQYLKELWDTSNICIYSGVKLQLPKTTGVHDTRYVASLDRIDSSKGYIKGNVQFISAAINYMKGEMTHEETITLCKLIAEHYKN